MSLSYTWLRVFDAAFRKMRAVIPDIIDKVGSPGQCKKGNALERNGVERSPSTKSAMKEPDKPPKAGANNVNGLTRSRNALNLLGAYSAFSGGSFINNLAHNTKTNPHREYPLIRFTGIGTKSTQF
jgi:hypothetical protein